MREQDVDHYVDRLRTSECGVCREIADRGPEVKITYRGWPGHFIASRYCIFRLNTLVEVGDARFVVSTVGNWQIPNGKGGYVTETVGSSSYYETMIFQAVLRDGHWDQDSGRSIRLNGKQQIGRIDITTDHEAQEMHEAAVMEIILRIQSGELGG